MAASKTTRPLTGFTKYNKETGLARPAGLILQDSAGNDWYIWVDTDGELRITDTETAEAAAFNWLTGGTVVGAQS